MYVIHVCIYYKKYIELCITIVLVVCVIVYVCMSVRVCMRKHVPLPCSQVSLSVLLHILCITLIALLDKCML